MRSRDENLMRFVRRVHVRLILVRAAERAGACVGIASVFACLFAAIALFQSRDAMQLVLPVLAIGAVVGLFWGFARRPTRFDAAVEADRQLELSDLLATAYLQRRGDDFWQLAVVAMANERCCALSPAAVVVHRYGGRAWGGIGLAAATGLTLALLSGVPQDSGARQADVRTAPAAERHAPLPEEPLTAHAAAAQASARPPAVQRDPTRMGGESQFAAEEAGGETTGDSFVRPGSDAAGGERAGQTGASSGDAVPRPAASGRDAAPDGADATAAPAGGGAADASLPSDVREDGAGGTSSSGNRDAASTPPPWAGSSWDTDRTAAREAVRSGRVPDAYRDVVSEYFRNSDSETDDR